MIEDNKDSKSKTKDLNNEICIALFRKGAHQYIENELLNILNENDNNINLSETSEKKIKKMIRQAVHKHNRLIIMRSMPKTIAIVLIVLFICTITAMSVEALRVPFFNLFIDTKENITNISIKEDQTKDNSIANTFGYIPDGYELMTEDKQKNATSFIFTNSSGNNIFIDIFYKECSSGVDTEDAEYKEIKINTSSGFYSKKNGISNLIYMKNDYTYQIIGSVDIEEIIKIASNIK